MAKSKLEKKAGKLKASATAVNMLDQFAVKVDETTKVSLPPMLKIEDLNGRTVGGKILAIHAFKGKGFKGEILQIEHESGEKFGLPFTGSMRYGVARFLGIDASDKDNLKELNEKAVGLQFAVTGKGKGTTKDGKRPLNLFDVYVSK